MANERKLGLRSDDKKVEKNWANIDWSKTGDEKEVTEEKVLSTLPLKYLITTPTNGEVMVPSDVLANMIHHFWNFQKCINIKLNVDECLIKAFWNEFWPHADSVGANWIDMRHDHKLSNFSYFVYGYCKALGYEFEERK